MLMPPWPINESRRYPPKSAPIRGNHVTSLTEQFYRVHPRSPNGDAGLDGFLTIEASVL